MPPARDQHPRTNYSQLDLQHALLKRATEVHGGVAALKKRPFSKVSLSAAVGLRIAVVVSRSHSPHYPAAASSRTSPSCRQTWPLILGSGPGTAAI